MSRQDEIAAVARAIAERDAVDWESLQSSGDAEWRDAVRQLKVIAEIDALHHNSGTGAGGTTWGPFRIIELVGHGTHGDVFRAIDTRLDREVALKLLRTSEPVSEERANATLTEARLIARVRHPSVVTIHGADLIDGRVGLWMELVDGRTLERILQDTGPLPLRDVAAVCVDVCGALDAVHAAGLIHRDVKAQNVMRDAGGRHVLMDFSAGQQAAQSSLGAAGTPLYVAPEVLDGGPASCQSDLYSAGVLLFHLATARYPVEARTLEELRARLAAGDRIDLGSLRPDYPRELIALINRAVSARPSERFSSAREMAEAASGILAAPSASRRIARRWKSAVVMAVVAAVAATPFVFDSSTSTPPSVRTQLLWDDATNFGGTTSADGGLLSFRDRSSGSLALRELTAGRTRVLVHASAEEDAGRSAVSPDGRWVAYAWLARSSARLRRVGIDGSEAVTLPLGPGVTFVEPHTWSPDGQSIAVAVGRSGSSTIELVSRDGTERRVLATGRGWPTAIHFSPDGQWVAYHATGQKPAVLVVAAHGREAGPGREIIAAAGLIGWAPDGRLLFVRERENDAEIYALVMTEDRAVGEPVRIDALADFGRMLPRELALGRGTIALGITTSGALIYGRTNLATDAVTVAVDPATGAIGPEQVGEAVAAFAIGGVGGGIRYSPDGTAVLHTPTRETIMIRSADGPTRTVALQLESVGRLEWAPDGRALIVAGARKVGDPGLYRVDIETGAASQIVAGLRPWAHAMSPDAQTLYYARRPNPGTAVVARDLRTGAERVVGEKDAPLVSQIRPSRDGRQLAILAQATLDILDLHTGRIVHRTDAATRKAVLWGGDWSPGSRYFFATVGYVDARQRAELWRISVDSGEVLRTPLAAPARGGWMRPDGRELSFMRWQERQQVWMIENALGRARDQSER